MNRKETIREIGEIIAMTEKAVENQPPKIIAIYKRMRDVYIAGQHSIWESTSGEIVSLTNSELSLINHYITCSSFITAWYHLSGENQKRDQGANSCTILVSSLGLDDAEVLRKYIETERLWRSTMKKAGVAPKRIGAIIIFVLVLIIIALVFGK